MTTGIADSPGDILPDRQGLYGPVTQARLLRTALIWLALILVGGLAANSFHEPQWRAAGLGLVFPGAGFLLHAGLSGHGLLHLILAMLGAGLFAFAVFIWFATGNILLAPAVWLLSAMAAATMQGPASLPFMVKAVPFSAICFLGLCFAGFAVRSRLAVHHRRAVNEKITKDHFRIEPVGAPPKDELTEDNVARLRFLLDRALQPVDRFDGFEWLDQFQTAAVRYQINFIGYALAMTQARYTPAMCGPFAEAQQLLLQKAGDKRVWNYWSLENLWGNLSADPDPCPRENIMYTGFIALQMAMARSAANANADLDVTLKLVDRGNLVKEYSFAELCGFTASQMAASPFGLMACEPNWIYPLCNTMGASAVAGRDAQTGGSAWQNIAQHFLAGMESEFIDAKGRFVSCRSARLGFGFPMAGGIMPQAMPCYFLNAIFPEIATRQWKIVRQQIISKGRLNTNAFWPIDTGNYGFSRASAYAATALAARELGDESVADACFTALDEECPVELLAGVSHRPRASVWAHAVEMLARSGGQDAFRNLIQKPRANIEPFIKSLPYPQAVCLSARVSERGLVAVFSANAPGRETGIQFGGLRPFAVYELSGHSQAIVIADQSGEAYVSLPLVARHQLFLKER